MQPPVVRSGPTRSWALITALSMSAAGLAGFMATADGAEPAELPCSAEQIATFHITWANDQVRTQEDTDNASQDIVDTALVDGRSADYNFTEVEDSSAAPDQTVVAVTDREAGDTEALLGVEQLADGSYRTEVIKTCQ